MVSASGGRGACSPVSVCPWGPHQASLGGPHWSLLRVCLCSARRKLLCNKRGFYCQVSLQKSNVKCIRSSVAPSNRLPLEAAAAGWRGLLGEGLGLPAGSWPPPVSGSGRWPLGVDRAGFVQPIPLSAACKCVTPHHKHKKRSSQTPQGRISHISKWRGTQLLGVPRCWSGKIGFSRASSLYSYIKNRLDCSRKSLCFLVTQQLRHFAGHHL